MLSDRPYMQSAPSRPGPSLLIWLLIINGGFFLAHELLQVLFPSASRAGLLVDWLALSSAGFRSGKIWTLVTYGFLHGDILHLLFNLLVIYGIGKALQASLGESRFATLYFGSLLAGGILAFLFGFAKPTVTIGSSAAVFSLITIYCFQRWDMPVSLLFLEITFKLKWLFIAILVYQAGGFLLEELGPAGAGGRPTSYSAHLGGILAGFLFFRAWSVPGWSSAPRSRPSPAMSRWFRPREASSQPAREHSPAAAAASEARRGLQAEVDRILDKINAKGFGSLSEEEKRTLDRAKDFMNR